ncbi:hypothetical protein JB92DRAFT_3269379 [Gautieria morchelliformis]|nr:hypothetical protein JB92DRAFT_3269379 [Gautieria morchelliformis]
MGGTSDVSSNMDPPEVLQQMAEDQDWTSLSRAPMSGNPGDTDVLHSPSDGDPMDIDDLISNDSESPLPTGGDRPIDHCHVENNAMIISEDRHSDTTALLPSLDLADKIRGYRLLELIISEQASSGLEPLSHFINYVSPGAYVSLTHVNFTTLDQFLIKPISVYGSKSEIVRLLLEIEAVDEDTASLLLMPRTEHSMHTVPSLTSGLYIFEAPSEAATTKRFYVVYWPEDTTWDDDAIYLTKIADQVLALVSPKHARALDFNKFATYDNAQSEDEVEEDYNEDPFSSSTPHGCATVSMPY